MLSILLAASCVNAVDQTRCRWFHFGNIKQVPYSPFCSSIPIDIKVQLREQTPTSTYIEIYLVS
jgi:hypothetical protein